MIASTMQEFAARHVAPLSLSRSSDFPTALWASMGQAGLFRIGLPAEFGGDGGGMGAIATAEAALVEGGGSIGFGLSWTGHQLVARHFVLGFATADQQRRYLPGLAAGTLTAAVAISEPGAGAHPKLLKTTARREGGDWILDGVKAWVTNGPFADLLIVFAISAMEGERKRYSAFIVPRDAAGLVISPMPLRGLKPSPHCQLALRACRVPHAAMLGPPGGAYEAMALPFRDLEDAVGTAGLAGALRFVLRRLAAAPQLPGDATTKLGELSGLVAVLDQAARALAGALDAGRKPDAALLSGTRSLAQHVLARVRESPVAGGDADLAAALGDLDAMLAIAQGPRAIKQRKLGEDLILSQNGSAP